MPVDVVLSFYATPDKDRATMQPVSLFARPPVVVPISPNGKSGKNPSWTLTKDKNGRCLPPLLAQAKAKLGGDVPGRVAVVGFSAGCAPLRQLLSHPADRAAIDAVIPIDGMHYAKPLSEATMAPWVEYGHLCSDASHLLALLHTAIVPANSNQIFSTTESAAFLFDRLQQEIPGGGRQQPWNEADLVKGPPPPAITIKDPQWGKDGKVTGYKDVVFETVPPMSTRVVGNCFNVGMPGTRPADHIFAANWGQRALWQTFLAPRWNGEAYGNSFSFWGALPGGIDTTHLGFADYTEDVAPGSDSGVSPLGKVLGAGALAALIYGGYRVWKGK